MKKTISIILCAAMLLSMMSFCFEAGAFTVDYGIEAADDRAAETAEASLSEDLAIDLADQYAEPAAAGVLPVDVYAYGGVTEDVDPRYPGAYYVFDEEINADTLTLENIGNSAVKYFEYDAATKTIVLFKHASENAPGSTISFGAWDSDVETVSGDKVSFPAFSFKLSGSFPNTGDNLVPYGDFEQGYAPAFFKENSFTNGLYEYAEGEHGYIMDASAYRGVAYPHVHVYAPFVEGATYKFKFRIRNYGKSHGEEGMVATSTTACGNFTGTQSGANTHPSIKYYQMFPGFTLPADDSWVTRANNVITVKTNTKGHTPETFSVYTNPVSGRTISYIVDDMEVYQRLDVIYTPGKNAKLKEGVEQPAAFEGIFMDGTGDPEAAVATVGEMPYEPIDDRWQINADKPWVDEDGNEYAVGDTINLADLNKSVYLEPNLFTEYDIYTVSFDSTGLAGSVAPIEVLEGTVVDLSAVNAAAVAPKRFNGWATTEGETDLFNAVTEIEVNEDVTLYPIVSYDFNFAVGTNYDGWSYSNCKLDEKQFGGLSLKASHGGGSSLDMMITRTNFNVPSTDISSITIYYDVTDGLTPLLAEVGAQTDGVYWTTPAGSWAGSRHTSAKVSEIVTIDGRDYAVAVYPVAASTEWKSTIKDLRIDPVQAASSFVIRAITFGLVPEENAALKVTGLDITPKPGKKPELAITEESGKGTVTATVWSPALKNGAFDANTAYSLTVTVAGAGDPGVNPPFKFGDKTTLTVDGEKTDYTINDDGTITFTKTFEKTPDAKPITIYFDGSKVNGAPYSASGFSGVEFDASAYYTGVTATDTTMRFNGWATTEGETDMFKAVTNEVLEDGTTLYPIISYDFNMAVPANRTGWSPQSCTIDNSEYLKITGTARDVIITKSGLAIPAGMFKNVKLYYLPGGATNYDGIFFQRNEDGAMSGDRRLSPKAGDPENGLDVVNHSTNVGNWNGTIKALRIDPFSDKGNTATLVAVVFEYCDPLTTADFKVEGIMTPVAGMLDNSLENMTETTGDAKVKDIVWTPALRDGRFEDNTAYSATVILSPKAGARFDAELDNTITFNGDKQPATVGDDGTLSATFAIGETVEYVDFALELIGEDEIYIDGKTHPYTVKVVSGKMPDKTVVWSVDNTDVAAIDANTGDLTIYKDGSITITATPSYNPAEAVSLDVDIYYYDFSIEITGPETIAKAERVTQYKVVPSTTDVYDTTATWSVDKPEIASIDAATGRLTPIKDGTVVITAVSNYHNTESATFTVTITNQSEPKTLHYDANTTDSVSGMPADETVSGTVSLSTVTPTRNGYFFLGWAASDDTIETIDKVTVSKDTTVYAVWGKGKMWTFGTNGSIHPAASNLYAGTQLVETENYAEYAARVHDVRYTLNLGSGIETARYQKVLVKLATLGTANTQIYYKTQYFAADDENEENPITIGYEANPVSGTAYGYAEAMAQVKANKGLGLDNFYTLVFDFYNEPSRGSSPGTWYQGAGKYVTTLYVDPYKLAGETYRISYIALLDSARTITFNANTTDEVTGMPEAKTVSQGNTVGIVETPVREGYQFLGWSKSPDDTENATRVVTAVDDITLYAIWGRAFDVENGEEDGMTVQNLGDLDPANGDGLLVTVDSKTKGTVITLSDDNGVEITETTNGKGMAAFKIEQAMTNAKLSVSKTRKFTDVQQMSYTKACDERDYVKPTGGSTGGGGGSTQKQYDMTVEDVKPTTPVVEPTPEEGAAVDENYVDPMTRSQQDGDILFNFDDQREAKLFNSLRQMNLIGIADSVANYQSLGLKSGSNDSPALTTDALAINADTHRYIVVKAKETGLANKGLRIYFRNQGGNFAEAKAMTQQMTEQYSMLVYDMSGFEDWKGTIERFMFSLNGNVTGNVEIDWILFTNTVPESMDAIEGTTELFPVVNGGDYPFTDTPSSEWYRSEVEQAWRLGFVKGTTDTTYEPDGNVTVAEAITLAVRLNYAYNKNDTEITNAEGEQWYLNYVNAAIRAGIIKNTDYTDYDAPALRKQVAAIMAKAVPSEQLKAINMFTSVPDVNKRDSAYGSIIKLYNAGVMIGSDSENNFYPETNITRAEVAAVVNRIAIPLNRKRVVTAAERESLKVKIYADDLNGMPLGNCVDNKAVMKGGYASGVSKTTDPIMYLTTALPANLNGADYSKLIVGLKWNADQLADPTKKGCAIFFTTPNGGWAEARRINPKWDGELKDGVGEMVFDLKSNSQFADKITALRFDPFDVKDAEFGIAYVILEP